MSAPGAPGSGGPGSGGPGSGGPSGGDGGYPVAAGRATAELRERGSRFLAVVAPASDRAAAAAVLAELERGHAGASHHCWAWRLAAQGPGEERSSDAGEPAGTAGEPMLRVLAGAGLWDVVAVVVRWFGGTKLGKGGLARAYAGAVKLALAELPLERRVPTVELTLELPYERLGAVKRLLHPPAVELVAEEYGAAVALRLAVHRHRCNEVAAALADLGIGIRRP